MLVVLSLCKQKARGSLFARTTISGTIISLASLLAGCASPGSEELELYRRGFANWQPRSWMEHVPARKSMKSDAEWAAILRSSICPDIGDIAASAAQNRSSGDEKLVQRYWWQARQWNSRRVGTGLQNDIFDFTERVATDSFRNATLNPEAAREYGIEQCKAVPSPRLLSYFVWEE